MVSPRLSGRSWDSRDSGDLKRLFDAVDRERPSFHAGHQNANVWHNAGWGLARFRATFGWHRPRSGEGSLFAKTLKTTLTKQQVAQYETVTRWKKATPYETGLRHGGDRRGADGNSPRTEEMGFAAVLLQETQPTPGIETADSYTMLLLAAGLPEAKLRSILDDTQWQHLTKRFEQAKKRETGTAKPGHKRMMPVTCRKDLTDGNGCLSARRRAESTGYNSDALAVLPCFSIRMRDSGI